MIKIDPKGRLWVMTTDNKIGIFDTKKFIYREIRMMLKTVPKVFHSKHLFDGPDGLLMASMGAEGIYAYDEQRMAFYPADSLIPHPKGWVRNLVRAEKGSNRFWMSCDSGIAVYNASNKLLSFRGNNAENDPAIEAWGGERYTFTIFPASGKRLFFSSWQPGSGGGTLNYFDANSNDKRRFNLGERLGYHEIYGELEQASGRVWVFGLKFIAEFTKGDPPFNFIRNEFVNEHSIKFDAANEMLEDRERNIWVCTPNGLYVFNPDEQHFNPYNLVRPDGTGVIEGTTSSALQVSNGQTWIATWGTGLYAYDSGYRPVDLPVALQKYQQQSSVWDMHQHSKTGSIWLVMQGGSLLVYDTTSGTVSYHYHQIFQGRTIRQVTEDHLGNLWFGTQHGHVIKWDFSASGGDPAKAYSLILKTGLVHRLVTDSKGFIWVAAMIDAFYKIDPRTHKVVDKLTERSLAGNNPFDIIEYNDSLMILSSGPLDIYNVNTGSITPITNREGLPSNNVLSMVKDSRGAVWLGMGYGLARLNLERRVFTFFDSRDGIASDNFKVAGSYSVDDGSLLFLTQRDFIVFDPGKAGYATRPPDVKITDIRVMNRPLYLDSISTLDQLTLEYDMTPLSIEFSTLTYLRQNKLFYYYMLEGLDKDWIAADDRRQALYSHLAPGTYTFRVKCENLDGIPGEQITSLAIRIQPPFWQTWWFYGIIVMLIIAVFYWLDKERIRRILALQQVRSQIAGNLHKDVSTTLSNINLLSELAKIKADRDLTKSKEFIDQINEKSKKMMDTMDDMLWSIHPENDSMEKTIERMTEHVHGTRKTYGVDVDMLIDEKVKTVELNMKSRHELFMIFKEALNNVVMHSGATEVLINLNLARQVLSLSIHDNGTGFDEHSVPYGKGIEEMRKRSDILRGELNIQSDRNGTSVVVKIPVRKAVRY